MSKKNAVSKGYKLLLSLFCTSFLVACAEPHAIPRDRDLPRDRGFSPSVAEEIDANKEGVAFTSEEARERVDVMRVSSEDIGSEWPIDTITYKRFRNPAARAVYLRRALGRYAFIQAKERGLGTSLERVRKVSQINSPGSSGEWWVNGVYNRNLLHGQKDRAVTLPETIMAAVNHSQQIAAFGDLPAIRGTAIQEAIGRFTPEVFVEASTGRDNSRATSPAVANGNARLVEDETTIEGGVRSRLLSGGEISLAQRISVTDTNRTSYIPGEQTESRAVLSYIQPLLREGGRIYTDAPRRIANMDTQIATEEFKRQSEAHLLDVERAYWNLYVARAVYLQTQHLAGHGAQIANQVQGRTEIDADILLANRARSIAERWRADVTRAEAALDNAEFRLAALINDPRYGPGNVEILPRSAPNGALPILRVADTLEQIFIQRPELQQAILQYEAALLREGIAANEALPELDLILEASLAGGDDGNDYGGALSDQADGTGYLVGLSFSVPLGFDERDARYKRRRIETVQQERQVLSAISTILLEIDVSANEYIVACNDLVAQRKALSAAQRDVNTLQRRWNEGVGDGGIGLLSALLDAYEDLQESEQAVATARATREISAANLARARGVLLERWGLKVTPTTEIRGEPTYKLTRN
ncbi:MAG: TolC family protein [Pseudomonadota bacterium]